MKIDRTLLKVYFEDLRAEEADFKSWRTQQIELITSTITLEDVDKRIAEEASLIPLVMYVRDMLSSHGFNVGLQEAKEIAETLKSKL